jgi:hypothetical protein
MSQGDRTMQWPRFRYKLRALMVVIAVLAIVFAVIAALWNRPSPVDPFDAVEMIGPDPAQSRPWKSHWTETKKVGTDAPGRETAFDPDE